MTIILYLLVGVLVGYFAGKIMTGGGFGLIGNLVIGVIGSFLGWILIRLLGFTTWNILGSLISAVVGAIVLLFIVDRVKK